MSETDPIELAPEPRKRPEPPSGIGGTICCDPYRNVHRFVVLIFMCLLSFGSYFCFDNPAALEDNFTQDGGLSATEYGWLYSVYSWPNVILSFFGGFLVDRVFGIRFGAILFSFFIMGGQIVFAGGALANAFWLMLVGRFIFALGGENLAVCQNVYAVKWFKGKELQTVFGVQLSFARIGSTVNMYVLRPLYNALNVSIVLGYRCLGATLMIGGVSTILSFICAVILALFDKRHDRYMTVLEESKKGRESGDLNEENEEELIRPKDILEFPATFWLICVVCVTYYAAIFPLISFGVLFFESKYGLDPFQADICNSLIYLVSILASPISGGLVDYFGRNVFFVIISTALTIGAHCLLAFSFISPYIPMVIMGIAYSLLAASLWPAVAFVIPKRALGTAYGVMQSIQNLGLAILFISAGKVVDTKGYLMLELYFLAFLCLALGCSILLFFVDSAKTGVLNMANATRNKFLKESDSKKQK